MKKIMLIGILAGLTITSCGPHRMKCGPGRRCSIEKKDNLKYNKILPVKQDFVFIPGLVNADPGFVSFPKLAKVNSQPDGANSFL